MLKLLKGFRWVGFCWISVCPFFVQDIFNFCKTPWISVWEGKLTKINKYMHSIYSIERGCAYVQFSEWEVVI